MATRRATASASADTSAATPRRSTPSATSTPTPSPSSSIARRPATAASGGASPPRWAPVLAAAVKARSSPSLSWSPPAPPAATSTPPSPAAPAAPAAAPAAPHAWIGAPSSRRASRRGAACKSTPTPTDDFSHPGQYPLNIHIRRCAPRRPPPSHSPLPAPPEALEGTSEAHNSRPPLHLRSPPFLPAKATTLRNPLTPRFRIASQNIRATLKRRGAYHAGIVCAARRARACRGVWRGGLRRQRRGENDHVWGGLPRAGRLLFPADKPNRRGRQATPGFPQKRREDLPHFHNRLVEHRPSPQAG